jgi:hypothetical protein
MPASPFSRLMSFACVGMGYCGSVTPEGEPSYVTDYFPTEGEVTADQFVEWLLLAEGLDPRLTLLNTKRRLRRAFVEIMGGASVRVERLREI